MEAEPGQHYAEEERREHAEELLRKAMRRRLPGFAIKRLVRLFRAPSELIRYIKLAEKCRSSGAGSAAVAKAAAAVPTRAPYLCLRRWLIAVRRRLAAVRLESALATIHSTDIVAEPNAWERQVEALLRTEAGYFTWATCPLCPPPPQDSPAMRLERQLDAVRAAGYAMHDPLLSSHTVAILHRHPDRESYPP